MGLDPKILVLGAVFLTVLLLVEGLYYLIRDLRRGNERNAVNRRLRMLAAGKNGQQVMVSLLRRPAREGWMAKLVEGFGPAMALESLLARAGSLVPVEKLILRMFGAAVILWVLLDQVATLHWAVAAACSALMAGILPLLVLRSLAARRAKKFSHQLADAVEMIARSLRAGHPVPTAIGLVANEMPDPVGSEFGLVYDEMTYGKDLREALDDLAKRVPVSDLLYMVLAVRIQYGTGGNLAEVLGALGRLIRERSRLVSKIRALSAEGRASALVLSLLPLAVVGLVLLLSPDYYNDVADHPGFHKAMGTAAALVVGGILVMRKMVNFRI